jgi:hypothetical protein
MFYCIRFVRRMWKTLKPYVKVWRDILRCVKVCYQRRPVEIQWEMLDYLYYNRQRNTLLMYNLLMFINIASCFDHNFGHHQVLNENSQVIKRWIQYGSGFVNRLLSSECVKLQLWLKRYKEYSQSYKYDKSYNTKGTKMDGILKLAKLAFCIIYRKYKILVEFY